ncbi:hypothetical protein CMV_019957 [Castanea mollissima]|uniref:Uncharacterized protein n=1 Tax=Castanea mollissima TaxID=60419 RepID=A0A8J4QRF8_9ROSI|nr:hypothetical protein CMV_019957 [Castanea mollissima]
MSDDEWVKEAMTDDTVVVGFASASVVPSRRLDTVTPPRRRRPSLRELVPTTPLSWSGATSASGGALDGFEESSRLSKPTESSRSKVAVNGETNTNKRSRKKRSLAELREEESLLLTERINLKNELAALRLTLEKQRATNDSLKRIKHDLQSQQNEKTTTASAMASVAPISDRPQKIEEVCDPAASIFPAGVACNDVDTVPHPGESKIEEVKESETSFVLPDLNLPFDDDSGMS